MIKGLEALEIIKSIQTNNYDRKIEDYTDIKEEYEYEISNIERELKALEIIKKCRIKVEKREDFDVVGCATFRKNGKYRYYINDIEITQEEYDILKEVFCNEK